MSGHMAAPFEILRDLFAVQGRSDYGGEAVTQWEHGCQAACLAEAAGAGAALVVAALAHDVGHLLHGLPNDAPDRGIDDVHERLGADWLAAFFPEAVVAPVRLHVPAKRYLCAVEADYLAGLSPPSLKSLGLQGGPMSAAEVTAFEAIPFSGDAVRLRRWDDQAKVSGLPTPPFEHFKPHFDTLHNGGAP
jgi:phosphonate degradation associated HDIG domain protein